MIFFFVHRFNDIDHFTPVVYKIAKDTSEKIMVLSFNPFYDISSDFRLNFLKESENVFVDYLYNIHKPSISYKIFNYFIRSYHGKTLKDNIRIIQERLKQQKGTFCHDLFQLMHRLFLSLLNRFKMFNRLILKQYKKEKGASY